MMTPRRMLGLAVTDRSIAAAEVAVAHGRRRVLHAAEFPMPEGDSARDPANLAKALRQFLRQNHFCASRCVIGLGARRLIAREKSLPPTAADLLPGVLSIAAEREFASDPKDLVFDFADPVAAGQGQSVLLVAAPRRSVDLLSQAAQAAGLTVAAVTSSMMALAGATSEPRPPGTGVVDPRPPSSRRLVLDLSPGAAELSVQSGGGFRLLRRLAISPPAAGSSPPDGWLDDLADELHRVAALLPDSGGAAQAADLLIWNATGLSAEALRVHAKRLSLEQRLCQYPADLGIDDVSEPRPSGSGAVACAHQQHRSLTVAALSGNFAAATALAAAGLNNKRPAVDFLHSRLDPRKAVALRKKVIWGGALAAGVLLAALALFLDVRGQEQDVQDLKDQLGGMKESLTAAKDIVGKAAFARGWYDRRPACLDCLRELTLAFPVEGKIWTTSLALDEGLRVLLSGKARDESAVLEVLDRLKADARFSDVKPLYIREVGAEAREVSFAISLNFAGAERS